MIYEFEVEGDIMGKGRPRVNTYTGHTYTPSKTKEYEDYIKQNFKIKYPKYEPFTGRVSVTIIAYFKIPKNTSKKNETLMYNGTISPTKKPDIDNIVKIILDGLNKMAFADDNQITKLDVEKKYVKNEADKEKVYIKIEEY